MIRQKTVKKENCESRIKPNKIKKKKVGKRYLENKERCQVYA